MFITHADIVTRGNPYKIFENYPIHIKDGYINENEIAARTIESSTKI